MAKNEIMHIRKLLNAFKNVKHIGYITSLKK